MSSPPNRRRRRIDDDDASTNSINDQDDELFHRHDNDNDRAQRLERRAAQRRRLMQREEILRLAGEDDDYTTVQDVQPQPQDDNDDNQDDNQDDNDNYQEEEEEEDGEDLMEHADRDYQQIAELDTYDREGMDEREYERMTYEQRQAAEQEMAQRQRNRSNQFYGDILADTQDGMEDDEQRRGRRAQFGSARGLDTDQINDRHDMEHHHDDILQQEEETEDMDFDEEELDDNDQVNLGAFDVPLREWIAQHRTRKEIQRRFRAFLRHYTGNAQDEERRTAKGLYQQKIRNMCANNKATLLISYAHLAEAQPVLAIWLNDAPRDMLQVLDEAATRHTLMLFPSYGDIQNEIHVRISDFPIDNSLRDLRRVHLDSLVKVHGVVTRRSAVYPQLRTAYYFCLSCKMPQGPFQVQGTGTQAAAAEAHTPTECPNGQCGGTRFKLHASRSLYRNVQRLNLQETPGSVPPGRVPRTKEILVADDLIDMARPGEEVEVTGVFENTFDANLTIKSGFPVFSTFITANQITNKEDASLAANLSPEDVRQIRQLAQDPHIAQRIVQSVAPSIFGHDHCKMALAMSLFGGVPKNVDDKHRIRGDVNVLLLGDPGTAKSQLLKYAENTAPRAVYSTGKGASAVGLTASVHKDPITKEWTLEGGALVLADKGCCLIDEFDKMNEQDRTSIHEAMEQQSISISKAGIVTSLQARCSVIAAANPIGGRYDSTNTLADNVELTDPILQRFDILCVLQDTVDDVADTRLAKFVTSSHMRSVPTREWVPNADASLTNDRPDVIPQDLLRKYIQYARTNVRPALRGQSLDQEKVSSLYVALRRESAASGGVPIAVRHVESLMRMAEAHAKMHLREYVREDDMDASIRVMLESFIMAQKFSVRRALRRSFRKFLTSGQDRAHLLLHILQDMFRREQMYQVIRSRQLGTDMEELLHVPLDEFESRARERRIYDVSEFCQGEDFLEAGYAFDVDRAVISRSAAVS